MSAYSRVGLVAVAMAITCAGLSARLGAHRLDEYLQATRLSVERDRVKLEMDLTAGVAVAGAVFALVDTDRSGQISAAEMDAYARQVVDSVVLTVDGLTVRPRVDESEMPTWREMSQGVGIIHLRASANLPPAQPGNHRLFFLNTHRSDMSVYLANALVPTDRHIEITGQRRDGGQRELTIDYRVTQGVAWPWMSVWPFVTGLIVAGALAAASVRMRRPVPTARR